MHGTGTQLDSVNGHSRKLRQEHCKIITGTRDDRT
jgi:hypothetical protein